MKIRRFYPKQIANRLTGRKLSDLTSGEKAALEYFVNHGQRIGVNAVIVGDVIVDMSRINLDRRDNV